MRAEEIRELEGILRHIYRFDPNAQQLNAQGSYKRLARTPQVTLSEAFRRQPEYDERDDVEAE
ncbi:hypothetical protein [Paraburkholderia elongata]|uniref:Uncharacterized protein n=1 Tax=Paraburkholderia elongata TaxID=2675747 RepID=A0A972SQY1_9BURK|nr:hypothetical protein [Paraburkholderia elongata]NPT62590.1 hypothetical protein [Paraburkholderia elongata]